MWVNIENQRSWHELAELSSRRHPFDPGHDPAQIAEWVHSLYIPTRRDTELLHAIQRTRRRSGSTKRHWLGVDAASNTGKSEMLLRFAWRYWASAHSTETPAPIPTPGPDPGREAGSRSADSWASAQAHYRRVPVIYVEADSGQQGAGLLRAIADAAGIPRRGNEDELRRRLTAVLPQLGTTVVIVDDAHMLRRTSRRAVKLTDSLRANLRIPVVFVYVGAGLHSSALLQVGGSVGYESAEQMHSRHTMLSFTPLTLRTDRDFLRHLIGDYLKILGKVLPHLQTPFRNDSAVLARLVNATDGKVGALMGLLKDGTVEAIHHRTPLTSDLLLELASHEAGPTP